MFNDNELAYITRLMFGAGNDTVCLCHPGDPMAHNPSDRLRLQ